MGKINVILRHEYLTRVRSKWFIISTLLGPVGMMVLIALPVVATMLAGDGTEGKIAVVDRTATFGFDLVQSDTAKYTDGRELSEDELARRVASEELQAYLVIPENVLDSGAVTLYSRGGLGFSFESAIESDVEPFVVKARLIRSNVDTAVIDLVEKGLRITSLKITDDGVEEDSSVVSAAIGYIAGFAMYTLIFLYGAMVMRGVVEEKANRIVEVLASSVKPYHIMMGKVIGIGLVGLTQVVSWLVLGAGVLVAASVVLSPSVDADSLATLSSASMPTSESPQIQIGTFALPNISILNFLFFGFYFLSGYFIYATLFAAIGSAVDQESDAQTLTLPVSLPIIFTIMFIGSVVSAPNSTLSVVLSLIPLFTPILMTVRVAATDVPWWQLSLSIVLCISTFMGAVWVASRIYRIGILSYGKKPTLRDVLRWIR